VDGFTFKEIHMSRFERRLKVLEISTELSPDKYSLIAILRELPEDAKLIRFGEAIELGVMRFLFHSNHWPEIREWEMVPRLEITIDRDMIEAAHRSDPGEMEAWGRAIALAHSRHSRRSDSNTSENHQCSCDVIYTGAHRHDCKIKSVKR